MCEQSVWGTIPIFFESTCFTHMLYLLHFLSCMLWTGRLITFGRQSSSTVAEAQRGEDSLLKLLLLLIPATTFGLGTWQVCLFIYFVSALFKIMLMYLRFAVVGWTLIFVFLWRWNVVSGRCSWSLSWTDSRLLSPSLYLWSKIMLEANTHTLLVSKSILLLWSGHFFVLFFVFQYNHLLQFRTM